MTVSSSRIASVTVTDTDSFITERLWCDGRMNLASQLCPETSAGASQCGDH